MRATAESMASAWKRSLKIPRIQSTGEDQISESVESALALHVTFSVFVMVVEIDVSLPAQIRDIKCRRSKHLKLQ